jgi:starch phosphorylase
MNIENTAIKYFAEHFKNLSKEQQLFTVGKAVMDEYATKDWVATKDKNQDKREVYYFSLEFLIGQQLISNVENLGLAGELNSQLSEYGLSLEEISKVEIDPALGNGGLGRLAACFMDSLASRNYPGHGMGIRYQFGLFKQSFENGYQQEKADQWLNVGNPWEYRNTKETYPIRIGGTVSMQEVDGKLKPVYEGSTEFAAVAYDMPMIGYKNKVVNTLRLWNAETATVEDELDFKLFNTGAHADALKTKTEIEAINKLLYPEDSTESGKKLRLSQQFFFTSAGLQSIIRKHKDLGHDLTKLGEYVAIQMNDTHPAIAVAELMRLLMDEEGFNYDDAWKITTASLNYTNHTILPEAIERWWIPQFSSILPRQFQIIEEINKRFVEEYSAKLTPEELDRTKIIQADLINMANLAFVGSTSVNGVANLHTEILKAETFKEFNKIYPGKIKNVTNGIAHRRWFLYSNPELADLVSEKVGSEDWKFDLAKDLGKFNAFVDDADTKAKFLAIKSEKKAKLAKIIKEETGITVDENSIFDVQVKRLHAYKRQLLNAFGILNLYNEVKQNPDAIKVQRTFIFGAKAAPGYVLAKNIIKLINSIADLVNNDPVVSQKMKVVFFENYRISLAENIFPASDVSEQISTASKEASGTGNMKFMMNGALTLGTLDGANVEISQAVKEDEIVIFGMRSEEVLRLEKSDEYSAEKQYQEDARLVKIMEQLVDGTLSSNKDEFAPILEDLTNGNDPYYIFKDFSDYVQAQKKVEEMYMDRDNWARVMLSNVANSGMFTSDRTIDEYAKNIWGLNENK